MYCIHSLDTIKGINIANNQYEFRISNDSIIVVCLSREWNILKPLWNTFLASDIITLLPIGDIKYVSKGDTIQFKGFESAYVGPKFVYLRKKTGQEQIH